MSDDAGECSAATNGDTKIIQSLSDFLKSVTIDENSHFVLGNPAGDADSIISAIGWAYTFRKMMPIVSIPRRQLRTQRPETTYLLKLAGISDASVLTCVDEVPKDILRDQSRTVTLVDHNRCDCDWKVTEIVDHHFDEGQHEDANRNIAFEEDRALVASTCTLVADEHLKKHATMPAPLAMLLTGVILIDSVNMSEQAGKGTARDRSMLNMMIRNVDWSPLESNDDIWNRTGDKIMPDCDKLFEALQAQKFDPEFWRGLSADDAISLDYKSFSVGNESFGIASILITLDDFFAKPNAMEEIVGYMKDHDLSLLTIMSAFSEDGQLRRQLALVGTGEAEWNAMSAHLHSSDVCQLSELRTSTHSNDVHVAYFASDNPKASRKQVAPIMMEFYKI